MNKFYSSDQLLPCTVHSPPQLYTALYDVILFTVQGSNGSELKNLFMNTSCPSESISFLGTAFHPLQVSNCKYHDICYR